MRRYSFAAEETIDELQQAGKLLYEAEETVIAGRTSRVISILFSLARPYS